MFSDVAPVERVTMLMDQVQPHASIAGNTGTATNKGSAKPKMVQRTQTDEPAHPSRHNTHTHTHTHGLRRTGVTHAVRVPQLEPTRSTHPLRSNLRQPEMTRTTRSYGTSSVCVCVARRVDPHLISKHTTGMAVTSEYGCCPQETKTFKGV
eukprot:3765073-Rhodomonas_salina.1